MVIRLPNNQQVNITIDKTEGDNIVLVKEVIIESLNIEVDLEKLVADN